MYVCICQAVTRRRIHEAVDEGIASMPELTDELGVASCCGCCEPLAQEILNTRLAERAPRAAPNNHIAAASVT